MAKKIRMCIGLIVCVYSIYAWTEQPAIQNAIGRINEDAIVHYKSSLDRECKINKAVRLGIQGGTLLALLAFLYKNELIKNPARWLFGNNANERADDIATLIRKTEKLEEDIKECMESQKTLLSQYPHIMAETEASFGSLPWLKYHAKSLWNSTKGMAVLHMLLASGMYCKNKVNSIFHCNDLPWFITTHTHLGVLFTTNVKGGPSIALQKSGLFNELIFYAQKLDTDSDYADNQREYYTVNVLSIGKSLVEQITAVTAFMEYKIDSLSQQSEKTDCLYSCMRYVLNCSNNFFASLEKVLQQKQDKQQQVPSTLSQTAQEFIAEFEQTLVSFARIEKEMMACS